MIFALFAQTDIHGMINAVAPGISTALTFPGCAVGRGVHPRPLRSLRFFFDWNMDDAGTGIVYPSAQQVPSSWVPVREDKPESRQVRPVGSPVTLPGTMDYTFLVQEWTTLGKRSLVITRLSRNGNPLGQVEVSDCAVLAREAFDGMTISHRSACRLAKDIRTHWGPFLPG